MLNWLLRRWNRRRAGVKELCEINEIILKSARRQNYDMLHLISYLGQPLDEGALREIRDEFHARCHTYMRVFDPADFGKNYKLRLYGEINALEAKVQRLTELCEANGIDTNPEYTNIFKDDIPF